MEKNAQAKEEFKKTVSDPTGRFGPDTLISGIQWKDFYTNIWPEGGDWYVEDMPYDVENENGVVIIDDDTMIPLGHLGYVCWQGKSDPPEGTPSKMQMEEFYDFVMHGLTHGEGFISFKTSSENRKKIKEFAESIGVEPVQSAF